MELFVQFQVDEFNLMITHAWAMKPVNMPNPVRPVLIFNFQPSILWSRLSEKVQVGSGALKNEAGSFDFIDQQPVGFVMTLPPAQVAADKRMIPMERVQRLTGKQRTCNYFEFLQIFTPPF